MCGEVIIKGTDIRCHGRRLVIWKDFGNYEVLHYATLVQTPGDFAGIVRSDHIMLNRRFGRMCRGIELATVEMFLLLFSSSLIQSVRSPNYDDYGGGTLWAASHFPKFPLLLFQDLRAKH